MIETEITKEIFTKAVGCEPEQDDLERCNCTEKGIGHLSCGWDYNLNKPVFLSSIKIHAVVGG